VCHHSPLHRRWSLCMQAGKQFVFLGTFSGTLLLYGEVEGSVGFQLLWTRHFQHPVVSVTVLDVDNVRAQGGPYL
jgi:hypothetical protein